MDNFTITLNISLLLSQIVLLSKLILSSVLGFLMGVERKKNEKPGGSRTFALLCLGACNLAILSVELASNTAYLIDVSRLLSYALASIGFIGSGVIIHNKDSVCGLTTASSLWCCVILGFLVGLGYYFWAISTFLLIYFILKLKVDL